MTNARILHSVFDWIHLTESWIFDQVECTPDFFSSSVWCDRRIASPLHLGDFEIYQERNDSPRHHRLKLFFNNVLRKPLMRCAAVCNFSDFDLIFSHFGTRGWHDLSFVRGLPLKKVVRFYGADLGMMPRQRGWMTRYRALFKEYDLFVGEGPSMANRLVELGAPSEKVKWVPLGIDVSSVKVGLYRPSSELRRPLRILMAATFTEKKGTIYGLQGVDAFVKKTGYPVHLTLVGDAQPYPDQLEIKQQVEKLVGGLSTLPHCTVERHGYLPLSQLKHLMQEHLVFIQPSVTAKSGDIEGGFPVTLTHAASNGMILVGSDHCDLPLIVRDGVNGYVVPQYSVDEIADALSNVMDLDALCVDQMRKASIDLVLQEFDARRNGERLYALLADVVASGKFSR